MDFSGPERTDFANVTALNRAFLGRLREPQQGSAKRQCLPEGTRRLVRGLTDLQVERLATTPFLLFSVGERDEVRWRNLGAEDPNGDLLANPPGASDDLCATAVSFLWQLAGRNPYAARLVSGARLAWCERLAAHTLVEVLQTATHCNDLLQPRFPAREQIWDKLLGPGLSSDNRVRQSAHITCLQWLLTDDPMAGYRQLRAAACNNPAPTLSVAEKPGR